MTKLYKTGSIVLAAAILSLVPEATLKDCFNDRFNQGRKVFDIEYPACHDTKLQEILIDFRVKSLNINLFSYTTSFSNLRRELVKMSGKQKPDNHETLSKR